MLNENDKNAVVGGSVVAALVLVMGLSYGGSTIADKAQVGTYALTAVFGQMDGLFEGDEVRMGGIRIGTVGTPHLDEHFRAVVTLNIESGFALPLDSSAAIHTDGLFGSKFVVVEPGGELDALQHGGTIEYTQGAVVVGELLELIIKEGKARQAKETAAEPATQKQ